jgi:hypothetical protein
MFIRVSRGYALAMAAAAAVSVTAAAVDQVPLTPSALRNHPAIQYQQTAPRDPVALLGERLKRGETALRFDPATGYLPAVLAALDVPAESQVLVFSKTSFQARKINPANPRALYFNDTVSVGWVRGGEVLELVAQDPRQGAIFYTLEQNPAGPPTLTRDLACVQCHTGDITLDVPGMFLGSVYPARDGAVLFAPVFSADHRTLFEFRWGGWYVTGTHAIPRHLGNATVSSEKPQDDMVSSATVHVKSLAGRFDMSGYLTPHSDMVALMVLEHEARLLNLVTRAGWDARIGVDVAQREEGIRELVDYMLFVDESPLPGPVRGSSRFAEAFAARGPRDSSGRSLRDLDLRTRLMRYPCSFLVYSAPFDALPQEAKAAIYERMWAVLTGAVTDARYARLTPESRRAVIEILRDTKPDLPAYFAAPASSP